MENRVTGIIRFGAVSLLVISLFAASLSAGGFENTGLGAKARGMGGAFRAIADDWSAAYYNPAGYAYILDNQLGANAGFLSLRNTIRPDYTFGGPADSSGIFNNRDIFNTDAILAMPSGGFVAKLPFWGETVFGLSAFQPFDYNIRWMLYRPLSSYNDKAAAAPIEEAISNNLDVVAFQLTAGREFKEDKLALGVGLQLLRGDLVFKNLIFRKNPYGSPLSDRPYDHITEYSNTDMNGWGFGLKGGALWKQSEKLSIGITAHVPFDMTVKGTGNLIYVMPNIPTLLFDPLKYPQGSPKSLFISGQTFLYSGDVETKLKLPPSFGLGFAYKMNEKLTLSLDAEYTFWSRFTGFDFTYSNLTGMSQGLRNNTTPDGATAREFFTANPSSPVDWSNTAKVALGGMYEYSDLLTVVGGLSYDQSPAKDAKDFIPQFMDTGGKLGLNGGLLLHIQRWDLGLATSYIMYGDRTATELTDSNGDGTYDSFPGTYKAATYETILSFNYRY